MRGGAGPLILILALAGCAGPYRPPADTPVNVGYGCADGRRLVVRFAGEDRATVRVVDGPAYELRAQGGDGAYAGGGITFSSRGRDATLDTGDGKTLCRAQG